MEAGFSKMTINPPLGMPMEGLLQKEGCKSIHDDLFVRSLYMSHQGQEVLIVSFDLLFFERTVVEKFKKSLYRSLRLQPEQIFLNTTHTHAGPRVSRWGYSDGPDSRYLDQLEVALLNTAEQAKSQQRSVTLLAGSTRSDLPVSRRKLDAQGKAQWWPDRTATICDALPFCILKDEGGRVLSILFSVACHPSMIYENEISADFPGAAVWNLNQHFATDGAIFLQGAAGDTKPRHVADDHKGWRRGTWEEMEAAGREVAFQVIDAAAKGLTPIEPELRTILTDIDWPLDPVPAREELQRTLENPGDRIRRRRWADDMIQQLQSTKLQPSVPVGLHLIQLGRGLRLIGVEGEVLAKLGNLMLEAYNRGYTFALGYTNGTQLYLPVTEQLPQGGYEVDSYWEYHLSSPCAVGCENSLLQELRAIRDRNIIPNSSPELSVS